MPHYRLNDLPLQGFLSDIHSGKIRLPEFQRRFEWSQKARKELLDSIQKGFPVGTLLLMEVESGGISPFGERTFDGVSQDDLEEPGMLVLDGQQRLSTCYSALQAEGKNVFALRLKELFERTGGKPGAEIDFGDLLVQRRRGEFLEKMLYGSHLLPLPFLTDRTSLRERLSSYRDQLSKNPLTEAFAKFIDVHFEGYLDIFFDYTFPCVILPSNLDLEAVCNIFTKINSTGLRLSAFDLCVATLFPHGENLRDRLRKAKDDERINLVDKDGTNVLRTVALLAGKQSKKAALPKTIKAQDVSDQWDEAVAGLGLASDFLKSIGIWDYNAVPYDAVIPALAASLAACDAAHKKADVKEAIRRKTGRWIYQTTLARRYNEGTDVKQLADFAAAKDWLGQIGGIEPPFLAEPIFWTRSISETGRSGAIPRAFTAILNELAPRDFMTEEKVGRGMVEKMPNFITFSHVPTSPSSECGMKLSAQ